MQRFLIATVLLVLASAGEVEGRASILHGKVTLEKASAAPAGSVLRVTLHDLTPGIARDASVAKATFEAEGEMPIRFELPYNDISIEPQRLYGVAAVLTNSRGQPLWETRVPIRVLTLGNQKKVELLLRPVAPPKPAPEAKAFGLDCGTEFFEVTLADRSATIVSPETRIVLPRVNATVGKKFSNGGTTLSVFGEAVYLQLPIRAYRDCKMVMKR